MEIEQICEQTSQLLKSNRNTFVKNDAIIFDATYTLPGLYPITRLSQKMENVLSTQNKTTSASETTKKTKPQFKVDFVQPEDKDEALALLKEFFFKDEPLNKSINLGTDCKELEEYCLSHFTDGCSFKATDANGKMVGVFINAIVTKPPADYVPGTSAQKSKDPLFKKILGLMDYVELDFDIFDLYPEIDSYMDGKIIAVDTTYRGAGIAGLLTDRVLEYMREHGVEVMVVMCSSHYSARVMEKMGFNEVYSLPYANYKVNGEAVFKPEHPHVACRIMTKELVEVKKKTSSL